ncbi:MAG TPA: asparagine synthase-related protein [Gemmatimonadales bacterium]|nr:asparagine synthase-related protein [Gemmatimonadales bacterium]
MASFFLVIDPDPDRRERAIAAFVRDGRILPHLVGGTHSHGTATVAWYAAPSAPVAVGAGGDSWVMGDRHDREGKRGRGEEGKGADGLFFAVQFGPDGVEVGADILGIMPVYYIQAGEVAVVASSPWACSLHPAFPARLDSKALGGVLLTNNLVNGESIFAGCRRLASGHRLLIHPPSEPREVREYKPRVSDRHHDLTLEEGANVLYEVMVDAVRRHLPRDLEHTVLLSGGLDSRTVLGIALAQKIPVTAVTYGIPTDQEGRCARKVTEALGIPHRLFDRRGGPAGLDLSIRWGGFTASPGTGAGWETARLVRTPRVTSGYLLDVTFGGSLIPWGYDAEARTTGFEPYFAQICRWGVGEHRLSRLLRRDVFGDSVERARAAMGEGFRQSGNTDLERSWWHGMTHRGRFHVGQLIWQDGFGAWPSAPAVDRRFMETALGFPLTMLGTRQYEITAVRQRLPALARVPLDRNTFDTTPLDPRLREIVRLALVTGMWARLERWSGGRIKRPDRRYYHRVFDFNGPAWRSIRAELEPHRRLASELFHQPVFDEIVPPAQAHWAGGDAIVSASAPKMLLAVLALLRWLREGAPMGVG